MSQSDTVTLTVILGSAAWNASTMACWFLSSVGSPQIEYSMDVSGPVYPVAADAGAEAPLLAAGLSPAGGAVGAPLGAVLEVLPPHATTVSTAMAARAAIDRGALVPNIGAPPRYPDQLVTGVRAV